MRAIVSIVVLIVLAFVAFVQTRPARFHVERTVTIDAPRETVFAHINDFRRWTAWSPYEKRDPQMQRSYDGPSSGVGARYQWRGNSEVGEGSARITESTPSSKVGIALEFIKPFAAANTAAFTLAPDGAGTTVTWAMDGTSTFVTKLIGVFMSMDRMIGGDFEQGLVNLKGVVESTPAARSGAPHPTPGRV
jgi:uncharacterized protein YndB with AHSA1/START domain